MGAYEGLNSFFGNKLRDKAKDYGYNESNILILDGNLEGLRKNHSQIYNNLISCSHNSDSRTPIQYGRDLVASWIFEDYLLREMQASVLNISLSGADRNRIVLSSPQVSASSDYVITGPSGNQIRMELVNDYTDFWVKNKVLHLRDNKFLDIQRDRCLLLAIVLTLKIKKYALFDFRKKTSARHIEHHKPFGGKSAYEIKIPSDMLQDFSIIDIENKISEII